MPPEQVPWDRRDFRKHDRSGSDPRFGGGGFGGGGPNRWREQHHHPHAPPHPPPYQNHHNHQQQRWYSDFRSSRPIPPGHGKQGGWHMYPDEAGPGYMPFGSRYGDRNLEDDNFRPLGSRGDGGRYLRNSRENRGSFSQKDWRSPSSEPAASSSGPGRPTIGVNNQKSVENNQTSHNNDSKSNDSSHPLPDSLSGQSQPLVKEKHEKKDDIADAPASPGQKSERENGIEPIDWKPLKWTRSGSLSSRSPGVGHSNSTKVVGVESTEIVAEVQHKNVRPIPSPTAVCAVSAAPALSDDNSSRKKPRLGWGEGLAKYEKKKVEGPEDIETEYGLVVSVGNTETVKSPSINLLDKSPRVASSSDCASPATPSSVACSSSPGIEEKESVTAAKVDHDTTNLSRSPCIMSQTNYEGPTFNLEKLDLTSIGKLSSLINEFLQSNDPSSVETGYVQTISMNKLLVWKVDILKALEVTESEIDSLETELKSLISEPRSLCAHPVASSRLPGEFHLKPCEEQVTDSNFTVGSPPLQVVLPLDMTVENIPAILEDEHVMVKDEEIDSPGSATSKLVEVTPSGEETVPSVTAECGEKLMNLDNDASSSGTCSEYGLSDEDNTCHTDDHRPKMTNFRGLVSVGCGCCDIGHIYNSILASNKDSLHATLEELNKLLPAQQCRFDIPTAFSVSSFQNDLSVIKEKFLMRKRSLRFKEKVITIKFKVFQHFWKEGRIVSTRKLRGKSHKKFDQSRIVYKKNRSSSRSKFFCSAGSPRTVPAEEVIDFVNRLFLESPFKLCRNTLRMPALILDKEVKMSRFISNNGLVEDPFAAEKERSIINPWSAEEREIFIDNLAIHGKDFKKIASFLDHKTIADCIEFYYKNHKSECFERARKKPDFAKQSKSQSTTYLVGTGKRWDREANAASLDLLGEASMIAANVNDQQKCTSRMFFGTSSSQKAPRVDDGPLQRSNSLDMYSNETVAADVLAGICGSLSSEAMSSCITSSVDPAADGHQDWKSQRVGSCIKRPLTPDVTQNIDDECSDESCWEMDSADWTDEEKSIFIQAVSTYGKDFAMISQCVRTRSKDQCKIFFSKARKCLGLDQIQPAGGNAASADANGGGSDIEDACVVQTGSVICNDGSECKMEEDLPPPDMKTANESDRAGTHDLKPDFKLCDENTKPCSLDSMAAEPVLKNLSMGDSQINDKPVANANSREHNEECRSELESRTLVLSTNTESVRVEEGDDRGSKEADHKALVEVSNGHPWEKNERQGPILPSDDFVSKKVENRDADSSGVTALSCAASEMKSEPQLSGNVRHPSVQAETGSQNETCSAEKSHVVIPLRQNGNFALVESSMLFSVPIKYQRHSSTNALSSVVGANGISEKHSQKITKKGDYQQQQQNVSYSLSEPVESSQILRGYPVSVQTVKEINGDVNWKKQVLHQNVSKSEGRLHSDRHTDFSLHKCSSSRHQSGIVQAPFPSQERSRSGSRPQSGSSSDVDKPSRSGDVKLFGKIIISSQEKASSCLQENGDNNGPQHNSGSQSLNLKFGSDQKVNIDSSQSKFDYNNYLGSESVPPRSFGVWDGNRTETGFALPDSTLLLNKYPAAFRNHSTPTVKLEQQPPLHGLVSNHHHPLNAVSFYSSGELSSSSSSTSGIADYQLLRNRDLQPFTMDMKQSQDVLYSDMQMRNGFDVMQQPQARGMVGINVVGRGGVLVGGQCSSGVSDPVTAIKMHYAKAQNFSIQAGNVIREDDTWRSSGDVAR